MDPFKKHTAIKKFARLNEGISNRFGISLNVKSVSHLCEVHEYYRDKRDFLISKHGYAALTMEDYAKAVMISETICLLLREIAPSRLKPRTHRKGSK